MERFIKGDVVVIPFPFSDLSQYKKRPALVIANLEGEDLILCQITSKYKKDKYSINLNKSDFREGNLKIDSFIRPNKIFTAHKDLILYKVGHIKKEKNMEVFFKKRNIHYGLSDNCEKETYIEVKKNENSKYARFIKTIQNRC